MGLYLFRCLIPSDQNEAKQVCAELSRKHYQLGLLGTIIHAESALLPRQQKLVEEYFGTTTVAQYVATPSVTLTTPDLNASQNEGISTNATALWQLIYSDELVHYGAAGGIRFAETKNLVFAILEESPNSPSRQSMEQQSFFLYQKIFTFLRIRSQFRLWRIWNYLAGITELEDQNIEPPSQNISPPIDGQVRQVPQRQRGSKIERYQQFNTGRLRAFAENFCASTSIESSYITTVPAKNFDFGLIPAACALGMIDAKESVSNFTIAFLAGKGDFIQIENPRQVSAYEYPVEYGHSSPTFSRAIFLPNLNLSNASHTKENSQNVNPKYDSGSIDGTSADMQQSMLFISGTASIVGHKSCHIGNVAEQCRESLRNIGSILQKVNNYGLTRAFQLADLKYLVYLRNFQDYTIASGVLAELPKTSHANNIHYLQAEICRTDLLIEIEAIAL